MSLENPGKESSKREVPKNVDLGTSFSARTAKFTRRQMLSGGAALTGAAAVGHLVGTHGADAIVGTENGDREKEREIIRKQLKEYEEARAKGAKEWAAKWWENFKKGYKEHGLNVPKAWGTFSEEALRARLARLDTPAELYNPIYATFFVGAAYASFSTIRGAVSGYMENRADLTKDKKIETSINDLATRVQELGNKFDELMAAKEVSTDQYRQVIAELSALHAALSQRQTGDSVPRETSERETESA